MKKQSNKNTKISIYLPEPLLKRLRSYAKQNHRSLNNYIVTRLDHYIIYNKEGEDFERSKNKNEK
jgi:hypothetical protein